MATRVELLKAREDLRVAILAAEEWQESYKTSPTTFRRLIELEAVLETAAAEYLHGLADRVPDYVDWTRLPEPIKADAGPVANNDDPVWKQEEVLLTAAVIEIITELIATGVVAGELIYEVPLGFSTIGAATLDESIMQAARLYTAELVSGVTATTRKQIRESVAKSIAMGEDTDASIVRLKEIIDNPVRAELIAQTEPVNAYQTGLKHYAMATGAKRKEWDGLVGACKLCSPLIGKVISIDETFKLDNGKELDRPAAHPRCRCGLIYLY